MISILAIPRHSSSPWDPVQIAAQALWRKTPKSVGSQYAKTA